MGVFDKGAGAQVADPGDEGFDSLQATIGGAIAETEAQEPARPTRPARLLSKSEILEADDETEQYLEVPEWDGWVRVIGISGIERDRLEKSVMQTNKKGQAEFNVVNMRAKLVALSVVDEHGHRLFGDDDVRALGEKSASALDRVYEVASKLSRITKADEDEMAKNSLSDRTGGSL